MNYILHIDTTTKKCSVALAQDGELMIQKELLSEEFSHSEQLHPFIEEVLKESGLKAHLYGQPCHHLQNLNIQNLHLLFLTQAL